MTHIDIFTIFVLSKLKQLKTMGKNNIKNISTYKGRFCAELDNGKFVISEGSMYLHLCEKVESGMKVIKPNIIAGMMMRTQEDFKKCVEIM